MSEVGFVVCDEGLGGAVPFGKGLSALGVSPILLTGSATAQQRKAWGEAYAEIVELENPYDPDQLAQATVTAARGRRVAALFSCYDGLSVAAARAARALGLPHPDVDGLCRSRNKLGARHATAAADLPTPGFAAIHGAAECARAAATVGFPAILKPLNGMASHLVQRVDSLSELRQAYSRTVERLPLAFAGNYRHVPISRAQESLDARQTLLLEEHLEGIEYSAEVIVRDGRIHRIALFHKFLVQAPGFLECGFTRPALTAVDRSEPVWQHIERCLRAVGVANAAAHVEVIDTESGPRLVEINAGRAGGQILVLAVKLALGIDLIGEILALALGRERPPALEPESHERVTTFTVFPPRSGRLEALTGLTELAALPRVARVVPFCSIGDWLDVDDKEVFAVNFLAWGGQEPELRALHGQACRLVGFRIEGGPSAASIEGAA